MLVKFYKVPKTEFADKPAAILNFTGIVNADRPAMLNALAKFAVTGADIVDCLLAARSSTGMVVCPFDRDMGRLNTVWEEPE